VSVEESDDSFWEEHKLGLSMTVGSLFAAAGALAMHRLNKHHADLEPNSVVEGEDPGEATCEGEPSS
jgi:hypothetical protein